MRFPLQTAKDLGIGQVPAIPRQQKIHLRARRHRQMHGVRPRGGRQTTRAEEIGGERLHLDRDGKNGESGRRRLPPKSLRHLRPNPLSWSYCGLVRPAMGTRFASSELAQSAERGGQSMPATRQRMITFDFESRFDITEQQRLAFHSQFPRPKSDDAPRLEKSPHSHL